jgi:effector-binding domain-containing protein
MKQSDPEIKHQRFEDTLIATVRNNFKDREEVRNILKDIKQQLPEEAIAGPAFCIIQFVTSLTEGLDAEIGFPVSETVDTGEIKTRNFPAMEVLSIVHRGSLEDLGQSYSKLFGHASGHGIISDEFCREIHNNSIAEEGIEIQFVIHKWCDLFSVNLEQTLGKDGQNQVMSDSQELTIETTGEERFRWVKGAIERLENLVDEEDRYDILSKCAHVFPGKQIKKLSEIFEETKTRTGDGLAAVDAVIDFMGEDPGWGERPRREGLTLFSSKKPRDPVGHAKAGSVLDKKKAYCFCPLVREYLEGGMPVSFCYCGAGWYRQQWEGATGKPVKIEITRSLLKGDDLCEFAIHLADDLG